LLLARLSEYRLDELPSPDLYYAAANTSLYASRIRSDQLRTRRLLDSQDFSQSLIYIGSATVDASLAAARLLECAYRFEFSMEKASHLDPANQAYNHRPEELVTAWSYERALRNTGQWCNVAALIESEASHEQIDYEIERAYATNR
jgi:hypothetical protein